MNTFKEWIDESHTITVVSSIFGVIGFFLALSNGLFTFIHNINEARMDVSIQVQHMSLQHENFNVPQSYILGSNMKGANGFAYVTAEGKKINIYNKEQLKNDKLSILGYESILILKNPTNSNISLNDFMLCLEFVGEKSTICSRKYRVDTKYGEPIKIEARDTVRTNMEYLFYPFPDDYVAIQQKQIKSYSVSCRDQNEKLYEAIRIEFGGK